MAEYDIMYFSPVQVGDERNTHYLYFNTEIYNRQWPKTMVDQMLSQIDELRHVELGMYPFSDDFKQRHRERVMFHCKMALAYLDSREARTAMKLCEVLEPSTRSSEAWIAQDPEMDLDLLRITHLSVLASAARRVKFYQKAVDALTEAKDICFREGEVGPRVHPLLTSIVLLNLSAVLGDVDIDEQGLRWGLEALEMMYGLFSDSALPEAVQAYYLAMGCHNAALLSVKLGRWAEASELVTEGINFTKKLEQDDDGLRGKLIAIGAKAKHINEGFFKEAVNALNGWGEERDVWDLTFWPFTPHEIEEEIHVLGNTLTLRRLVLEAREDSRVGDDMLARLVLAVLSCSPLESVKMQSLEIDPKRVWRRMKKQSFLETSWYASAMNYTGTSAGLMQAPEAAGYQGMLQPLISDVAKKIVLFLLVLGNESKAVDFSDNDLNSGCISALVQALRYPSPPKWAHKVQALVLRGCGLDAGTAAALARAWAPPEEDAAAPLALTDDDAGGAAGEEDAIRDIDLVRDQLQTGLSGATSLDVSHNDGIGDEGFQALTVGIALFRQFQTLTACSVGLGPAGCASLEGLAATSVAFLDLSNNDIGSDGASIVCRAALRFAHLHELRLNNCAIQSDAAQAISELLIYHPELRSVCLDRNQLGSEGTVELCMGASQSTSLRLMHIGYNDIQSEEASQAIGRLMTTSETLQELKLSGNRLDLKGAPVVGSAIEQSALLVLKLEDMGFTEESINEFLDHGVAETQDLQVMVLSGNPVGDEGLAVISESLSIGLTDLALSDCALTVASQATLLNLVSLSPNLRSLDLSNNALGSGGLSDMIAWMTQAERENFSLRSLELAGCGLGDEGLIQLTSAMSTLTYLGLRNNGITSYGVKAVMNSHKMIQLERLDLADNSIDEEGVHALTERFQQEHKRSLWNPKQLTSSIDEIILANNGLPEALAKSTEVFLNVHNPLLHVVW